MSEELKKVSVIIPNYNYAHFLPECIESVIGQTYKNWELIVVDDNSTDNSRGVVQKYIEEYPELDIKLIHNTKGPSGTPTPINIGIENMTGDYFAWLSSDDIFMPEKLEEQVYFMNNNTDVDLVYCSYFKIDDNSFVYGEHFTKEYNQVEFFFNLFNGNLINGNTILVRKSIFEKTGLYLTTHPFLPSFWYVSEYLMYLEIMMHGKIKAMRQKLHKARIHENNMTYNQSTLGFEIVEYSRKVFLNKYPVEKIFSRYQIGTEDEELHIIKLWKIVKKYNLESSFFQNNSKKFNDKVIFVIDKYEAIKIAVRVFSSLIGNMKFKFAEEQYKILIAKNNIKYLSYCEDVIEEILLKTLNTAKIYFSDNKFSEALMIMEYIVKINFIPENLKCSAYYYLSLCYKETENDDKEKHVLVLLLNIIPDHQKAISRLSELDKND